MSKLLSKAEALEVSGLSKRQLNRRLANGTVPGAHHDERGRVRIPEESAKDLKQYEPLTEEEKRLIAARVVVEGNPYAPKIMREINAARQRAGKKEIGVDAVYRQVRGVREQVEGEAENWVVEFLKAMQSPEFVSSLQTSPRNALSMLDLKGLPADAQKEVRRLVEITLNHMRFEATLPEEVLTEEALKLLHPAERELVRGTLQGFAEGLQAGMEAGLVGGANHQARKSAQGSENPSIEKPGTTPARKQAVPSPPNPTGNASVPGSPSAENRKARAQNRGSDRVRVVMTEPGEPKSLGGFARISDLKRELGWPEEKIRGLFGLLNDAKIGNYEFLASDLRERGYSGEDIRKIFVAFEEAFGELPHEKPRQEE